MHRHPILRKRAYPLLLVVLLFLLTLFAHRPTFADSSTIRQVPNDYATIAMALATAQAGDTVQVAPGTYTEGMLHIPANVTLRGSGWGETTIDGNGSNVVLYPGLGSSALPPMQRGFGL